MSAALRAELRKLSTTRMWWLTTVAMAGYMALMGVIMAFSLVMGNRQAQKAVEAGQAKAGDFDFLGDAFVAGATFAFPTEYRRTAKR